MMNLYFIPSSVSVTYRIRFLFCYSYTVRMMGYLIRFIHNRDLAAENIVTAYIRSQFLLQAPAQAITGLRQRFESANMRLNPNSMLHTASEVCISQRTYILLYILTFLLHRIFDVSIMSTSFYGCIHYVDILINMYTLCLSSLHNFVYVRIYNRIGRPGAWRHAWHVRCPTSTQ